MSRNVSKSWLICAVVILFSAASGNALEPRPNVLVITVDDMSCDSVGVYGCDVSATSPNMDAFARSALRFRYAHVQVGNCMPSRNVMWSGRMPHNNGVEGFYQNKQPGYPVLCELAKSAGYFTAIRHKVSHSTPYAPFAWDMDLDQPAGKPTPNTKDASSYGESLSEAITEADRRAQPFCVLINIADPHKPFYSQVRQGRDPHVPSRVFEASDVVVPKFLPDDPVVRDEVALYYSSVRRADDAVGSVLEALEASGKSKSTFVMFLSDHGMPLPFAKTQLYHHSTHTPLMVRWPGTTASGHEDRNHMVSAVDFLPTLLDVMQTSHPAGLDGRSFATVLAGELQSNRNYIVKEYNENSGAKRNPMRAIQDKRFLYIFNPWSNGSRKMATATNSTATYRRMRQLAQADSVIAKRLDLADYRVPEEFYDVASDPDCLNNLIGSSTHQGDVLRLRGQLMDDMRRTGDPVADVLASRTAEAMEAYVQRTQEEADQRRGKKRRAARPARRKGLIKLRLPEQPISPEYVVEVVYQLDEALGEQKLQVTVKDAGQKRIERKVLEISGNGKVAVPFTVPSGTSVGFVAAFVGDNYDRHLEHVQTTVHPN